MRQFLCGMLLLLAASGQGAAASFVVLPAEPPAKTPSIVLLGEPVAAAIEARPLATAPETVEAFVISPSVIAFGAEAIPTASEQVASIGGAEKPRWTAASMPLVIRGGMIGDAFSGPGAPEVTSEEASAPTPQPQRGPSRREPTTPPASSAYAPQFRAPR